MALIRSTLLFSCLLISACSSGPQQQNDALVIEDFGKSTVDQITELHVIELRDLSKDLMVKLYKRNPRELRKLPDASVESRLEQLFDGKQNYRFAELDNKTGTEAVNLAFDKSYTGDRVFALMVGLKSMLHASYDYRTEFYYFDSIDQQTIYNSARNLEVINWRLNNHRDDDDQLHLLSNGYHQGVANLSYERLFGKMICIQDMMAKIVADRTNRTIINMVQSAASSVLIPIGI